MIRCSETRTHRLDAVLCNIMFFAISIVLVLSVLGFIVTHTHVFYVAYNKRIQQDKNDAWLVQQCKSSEFYSNMKHHASLCDDVTLADADAIWLHALRDVFEALSVCGVVTCEQRINVLIDFMLGRGLFVFSTFIVCIFLLMLMLVPCYRMYMVKINSMHHGYLHDDQWRQSRSHAMYPQLSLQ